MSQMTDFQRQQLMYDKFEQEKRNSVLGSVDRSSPHSRYDSQENEHDRIQREGQARRREIEKNDELTKSSVKSRKDSPRSRSDSTDSSDDSDSDNSSDFHHYTTEYISLEEMKSLLLTYSHLTSILSPLSFPNHSSTILLTTNVYRFRIPSLIVHV